MNLSRSAPWLPSAGAEKAVRFKVNFGSKDSGVQWPRMSFRFLYLLVPWPGTSPLSCACSYPYISVKVKAVSVSTVSIALADVY